MQDKQQNKGEKEMNCPIYDLQMKYHVNINYLAVNYFVPNACNKCDGKDLECRTNQFFQEKRLVIVKRDSPDG